MTIAEDELLWRTIRLDHPDEPGRFDGEAHTAVDPGREPCGPSGPRIREVTDATAELGVSTADATRSPDPDAGARTSPDAGTGPANGTGTSTGPAAPAIDLPTDPFVALVAGHVVPEDLRALDPSGFLLDALAGIESAELDDIDRFDDLSLLEVVAAWQRMVSMATAGAARAATALSRRECVQAPRGVGPSGPRSPPLLDPSRDGYRDRDPHRVHRALRRAARR